jgi:5-hydroxyisourate hydrolase
VSNISTHVLDMARGHPAVGVAVELQVREAHVVWHYLAEATTDDDGRVADLLPEEHPLASGAYRLIFKTGDYFEKDAILPFYPDVTVAFEVRNPSQHYHVPLLISPYGFTTYRGS